MRIEFRKSVGKACERCGARELLYVPSLAQNLEVDLLDLFNQKVPFYRPLKKRRFAHFAREVERVSAELRDKTRHQVS